MPDREPDPTPGQPVSAAPAAPAALGATGFGGGLREKLLKSAAQFSIAVVASQASGLLRAWFVAHALGPAAAGVWIGIQLVVTYAANAHLGAIFGLHRHVPLLRVAETPDLVAL